MADIFIRPNSPVTAESRKDLLGGVTVLKVPGSVAEKSVIQEPLYQSLQAAMGRSKRPFTLTFIPYYAMQNREPTPMEFWVPMSRFDSGQVSTASTDKRAELRMQKHGMGADGR